MDRMRRANVECWNFKLDFWPEKRSLYFSNFPLIGVIWASPTATDPSTKVSREMLGHNLYYVRGPQFILPIPASGVHNLYYFLASGVHNLYYFFKSQRQGSKIYTNS